MAVKDLVSGVLAESITTSTTNILVTIAQSIGLYKSRRLDTTKSVMPH